LGRLDAQIISRLCPSGLAFPPMKPRRFIGERIALVLALPSVWSIASPRPLLHLFDTGADPQTLRAGGRVLFEERAS
jgi:hypothetical protein